MSDFTSPPDHQESLQYGRTILFYTLAGAALGVALTTSAWMFEFQEREVVISLEGLKELHRQNGLLWLIDLAPVIAALIFAKIGGNQARIERANRELEDRVTDRTFQITLEKARTSAILDTAADAIVTFNGAGMIVGYNNAAERIFGYHVSEAMGRQLQTIVPALDSDPRRSYSAVAKERGGVTNVPQAREFEGLRKDGTTFPIEVDISRFTIGEEASYTAIIRDITERKRQERLQRSLMEVSEAVNQVENLKDLYESIHEALSRVMEVGNFYIALYHADTHEFEFPFVHDELLQLEGTRISAERTLMDLVRQREEPVILDRAECDGLVAQGMLDAVEHPFHSWLGVPLETMGKKVGVMVVQSYVEGVAHTEKDIWILTFVSAQIASAIDRENARESIRSSERRYRRIVEEAGDIVYTTDREGRLTYVNPSTVKLTGYREKELIGMPFPLLVREDMRRMVQEFYERQLEELARETTLEFPIVTKDMRVRWIEQSTTLIVEEDHIVGCESIVHDVTLRREAEEGLREREERFRSLSASSPIGIFQLDERGRCIYVNGRFEEITGRASEECLGTAWMDVIHPEERDTFRTEWIFAREEGASAAREVRVLHPSGDIRWVNIRWASTLDPTGRIIGFVGTFEDITTRKGSERVATALHEISQASQESTDLEEFYARVHTSLTAIIDTTNFYIAMFDEESQIISFPYAFEDVTTRLELPDRKLGKGLTGLLIRRGKPMLLDREGMRRLYDSGQAELIGKPAEHWLGVPLVSAGKVFGAIIIQSYTPSRRYTEADVQTLGVVSSQLSAAILRKQSEQEAREYFAQLSEAHDRIKQDLELAAKIQRSRLPKQPPAIPEVEVSWLFDSCDEVAGDMFNFVQLDEHHLAFYILDVSGHGVSAALLSMSLSRALTATSDGSGVLLRQTPSGPVVASPREVAEAMNERFPMNLETNQYFTMLYGILDLSTLSFRYVRGGHPAPVLVSESGTREIEEGCGPAIGIIPNMAYQEVVLQLKPHDRIYLFTDGVDETTNTSGEEFGFGRISAALEAQRDASVDTSIRKLRETVRAFSAAGVQSDDITIVGFRITSEAVAASALPLAALAT